MREDSRDTRRWAEDRRLVCCKRGLVKMGSEYTLGRAGILQDRMSENEDSGV